jgi:(S)-ureidoglycine aminohydrolase
MDLFDSTRSRVCRDHALITPNSFVRSTLPGWENTEVVILIAPPLGARFLQYLAFMAAGASGGPAPPGVERVIYVLEGEATLHVGREQEHPLGIGSFAFVPPNADARLRAKSAARLNIFEKRYEPQPGIAAPRLTVGREQDVQSMPFLGDPDAMLKTLLPVDPAFDLAVNLFTFRPGAALPLVEVHVMEHGLLMVEGQGVYRLADAWYPVREGDVIWMASYCPQWFVAMGKGPARYLYYKDVNRDPLQGSS